MLASVVWCFGRKPSSSSDVMGLIFQYRLVLLTAAFSMSDVSDGRQPYGSFLCPRALDDENDDNDGLFSARFKMVLCCCEGSEAQATLPSLSAHARRYGPVVVVCFIDLVYDTNDENDTFFSYSLLADAGTQLLFNRT